MWRGCVCVFYMTPESRKKTLPARLWANLLYVMPVTSGHYTHIPSKNAKTFQDLRGLFSYDLMIFSTFSVFVLRYWIPKLWDNCSDSIFLMLWRLEATVITYHLDKGLTSSSCVSSVYEHQMYEISTINTLIKKMIHKCKCTVDRASSCMVNFLRTLLK